MSAEGLTKEQADVVALYEEIVRCTAELTPEERRELRAWEWAHVDGSGEYGTSDWPGWRSKLSPAALATLNAKDRR